jgi:hypothetical protein
MQVYGAYGFMRLTELEASFLKSSLTEDGHYRWKLVNTIYEADGIFFLCPACFKVNGGVVGTHAVICWDPTVAEHVHPRPGRWDLVGDSLQDLTLVGVGGSSSIQLQGRCKWHGFIRNGEVLDA